MTREYDRGALALSAAAGRRLDRGEFARLVQECDGLLYNMGRTMLHSDADCRDAIQETILCAWCNLSRLRNPAYFRTWLVRIMINQCRGQLRRSHYAARSESVATEGGVSSEAMAVRSAVEALPDKLRPVVVLYYYEDFPIAEIARALGIPQGTVKSRLAAARRNLRKELE